MWGRKDFLSFFVSVMPSIPLMPAPARFLHLPEALHVGKNKMRRKGCFVSPSMVRLKGKIICGNYSCHTLEGLVFYGVEAVLKGALLMLCVLDNKWKRTAVLLQLKQIFGNMNNTEREIFLKLGLPCSTKSISFCIWLCFFSQSPYLSLFFLYLISV